MYIPILAMHIPDGFLNIPVSAIGWVFLILILSYALKQTQTQLRERQIPLMGILAAFVFAAQMINFPVAGGTSGHLLGATLVAIFVGPWAAILIMTCVIGVQSLLFQDGGLLALGFNITNMGIISAFGGYLAYKYIMKLMKQSPTSQLIGAGIGAWLGVVLAAIATSLELAVSGTSPLAIVMPAMIAIHIVIGLGEALITVAAIAFVRQTRPDLIGDTATIRSNGSGWIVVGLMIALILAFASPLADSNPDGLERVAQTQGFEEQAEDSVYEIMPDYTVPFIQDEIWTTIIAAIIGIVIVSGIGFGVARLSNKTPVEQSTYTP